MIANGRKYFGKEKIADTGALRHPCLREPETIYDGVAWANALAKRGYVVLVPDAFGFGSRRCFWQTCRLSFVLPLLTMAARLLR